MSPLEKFLEQDSSNIAMELGGSTVTVGAVKDFIKAMGTLKAERASPDFPDYDSFRKALKPGDVLFTRSSKDASPYARLLQAFGGDPDYHSALYTGRGNLFQIAGDESRAGGEKLWPYTGEHNLKSGGAIQSDVAAYRPTSGRGGESAVRRARELTGREYEGKVDSLKRFFKTHLNSPQEMGLCPHGDIICTDVVKKAYPKAAPSSYTTIADVKQSGALKPVGRFNRLGDVSKLEKFLAYGVNPVLKNLKYGLLAGGVAGGGAALNQYLSQEEKS